jgi:hypothetical protein
MQDAVLRARARKSRRIVLTHNVEVFPAEERSRTEAMFEFDDRTRFEVLGVSLAVDDRSDVRARLASASISFTMSG